MTPRRAPDFWWRPHSLEGFALAPLGAFYGRIAEKRWDMPGVGVGIPVVCVGNLVLGGAGKTPTALEVANICRRLGHLPGFLTRGYGGSEAGPVLVSVDAHTARDVGDEALLLARHARTVVSADRPSGAKLLAGLGCTVVVMDDGFQNPSLIKDLSLVVVDSGRGTGNGRVFPAGPLRAALAAQIRRAGALVIVGKGAGGESVRMAARAGLPILYAEMEQVRRRGLRRRPYLAFAGIGDPAKFYAALEAAGAQVGFTMDFPDHHMFSDADCERILAAAKEKDLVPITTEKDRMRLSGRAGAARRLDETTETLPIRIRFDEPLRLKTLIGDALAAHAGVYRRTRMISALRSDSSRSRDAAAST
jgi:tetraacyldisaccharide 4'-kinase